MYQRLSPLALLQIISENSMFSLVLVGLRWISVPSAVSSSLWVFEIILIYKNKQKIKKLISTCVSFSLDILLISFYSCLLLLFSHFCIVFFCKACLNIKTVYFSFLFQLIAEDFPLKSPLSFRVFI